MQVAPLSVAWILFSALTPAIAATRQAQLIGWSGNGDGKCRVKVEVAGSAEVTVAGSKAELTSLSGGKVDWQDFDCTFAMPSHPDVFELRPIDGEGDISLVSGPRENGGRATVRIDNHAAGSRSYQFELSWGPRDDAWRADRTR